VIRNNWPNILNRVMRILSSALPIPGPAAAGVSANAVAAQDGGRTVIGKHRLISREFTDSEVGLALSGKAH
jgi:hypothetical protein